MFTEFAAEAQKALIADTPDRKFRREYYESKKTAEEPATTRAAGYFRAEPVGPREATLLKVARFIRLA